MKTEARPRSRALSLSLRYAAALADELGYSLDEVARMNLRKLADRRARNVIHGSGDDR